MKPTKNDETTQPTILTENGGTDKTGGGMIPDETKPIIVPDGTVWLDR